MLYIVTGKSVKICFLKECHVDAQIAGPSISHLNTTEATTCFLQPLFSSLFMNQDKRKWADFLLWLLVFKKMRKRKKLPQNRWTFWTSASAASTSVVGSLPPLAPLWDATLAPCGASVPLAVPLASLLSAPFTTGAAGATAATGAGGSLSWKMPLSFSTWMYGPTWPGKKVTLWLEGTGCK